MSKIEIPTIAGGYNLSAVNDALQKIEDELNNKVLYRTNPAGEPNAMAQDLDMNSKQILNLPAPSTQNSPARLADVQPLVTGLAPASLIPFTPAANVSATTVQSAIEEVSTESASDKADLADTSTVGKGDALIGVLSTAVGAVATTQHQVNEESTSVFRFMTASEIADVRNKTATIDVSGKIQLAATSAGLLGGEIYLPAGDYKWGSAATVTLPPNVSLRGAGPKSTRIVTAMASSSTPAFAINGATVSSEVRCRYGDLSIVGNGLGQAFQATEVAYAAFENIYTNGLNLHFNFVDVLSSQFRSVRMVSGETGVWARLGSASRPNALTFDGCVIGSMNTNGIRSDDGTTLTYLGGSIEGCGAFPASGTSSAVFLNSAGHDGTWAACFVGTYFENNAGRGDVYLISSSSSAFPAGVSFPGCTFNRTSNTRYSESNVYVVQAGGAGALVVDVSSAGFNGFNSYSPSAGRPYVNLSNADATNIQLIETGAVYGSATEAPTFNVSTITAGTNITLGTTINTPKVRRDDQGFVHLSGRLTSSAAIGADTTIGTLDSKHRPNRVVYGQCFLTGAGSVYWYVDTAGLLKIGTAIAGAAQDVVLDGIRFKQVN